jgi:FkbH-like protein
MFVPWQMPWLPDAPEDFRARLKAVPALAADHGAALAQLALHRLNSTQARAFAKTLRGLAAEGVSLAPLAPFRLAVLSSATFDTIEDALVAAGARHGVALDLRMAEYDQIIQTAFNPAADVFADKPDAVFVHFDHHWLALDRFSADPAGTVDAALDQVSMVLRALSEAPGAQIIVSNVATPPGGLFGSIDRSVAGTQRAQIAAFNRGLHDLALAMGALILDVAGLAEQVGTTTWFDPVMWNLYKLPIASDCAPLFADAVARMVGALRGKARKCLVLDCDNTLWGGVIGDDGMENILIGSGNPEGESFLAVQQLAIDLKKRGIILAVCSKNFDETARQPFREHADMLLRESDIAVFQANWTDKPSNLEAIAATLEIGLDALVFLDDNSAERAQVRAALPMVAVPELPADPAYYPLYLASAGYFEALAYSTEDSARVDSYIANAQRAEVKQQARDLGDYLRALDMTLTAQPFDAQGRARISQLINKSNQFNLTTLRYSEVEVRAVEDEADSLTLQVRLKDKFSDFGMIGVVIARPHVDDPDALDVDTWLMSCRVLGRRVEEAMLKAVVERAREAGKSRLYARYLPTPKNGMVRTLFDALGLELISEEADGERRYRLDLTGYTTPDLPFSREPTAR